MSQAIQEYPRIWLDKPRAEHCREFIRAMRASRGLHHPWLTAPYDPDAWRRYLDRLERKSEEGFLVRKEGDNALCGVVNLSVITWEALCSAYISYYVVQKYAQKGYMKEGLQQVIDYAFVELGLHRLEANIQRGNERSIRLVESLGFQCEGYSPRFIRVNGMWRDHERWALLAD